MGSKGVPPMPPFTRNFRPHERILNHHSPWVALLGPYFLVALGGWFPLDCHDFEPPFDSRVFFVGPWAVLKTERQFAGRLRDTFDRAFAKYPPTPSRTWGFQARNEAFCWP